MSKQNSYADHLKEWEDMTVSAAANASDLPQLELARIKLEGMLADLREILSQQAVHRASKQQLSKQARALVNAGKKTAAMIRSVLKEYYGITSDKLVEFGVQPRRVHSRKSAPVEKPAPEANAPPSPDVK